VSLEPCSHHGRTPPCSDALIEAGVVRVVAALRDPNPQVAGQGIARLREAGIAVACGLLEAAEEINRGFVRRMKTGRPWVTAKLAMSLDGRTALAHGESKWITSAAARRDVHRLRARSSAILTGVDTVLADDPALTARLEGEDILQPLRVVLDSRLRTLPHAQLARQAGDTLILTISDDAMRRKSLEAAGFEVLRLPDDGAGRVSLTAALDELGRREVNELMVEAGPTLNGALLQAGLVDEWVIYMAPSVLGDAARGLFNFPPLAGMEQRFNLDWREVRRVGEDLRLRLGKAGKD
jgi:diaminohydroxyphosphoribosylaminopyrimidine deaminase/5-amino-6-(5-phosphoribosylamino)uracil reductase